MTPQSQEGNNLSTEAETSPETGVDATGTAAPADDIDTDAFDRVEAPDEGEEAPEVEEEDEDDAEEKPKGLAARKDVGEDGLVDLEIDGQTLRVPAKLKDAHHAYADYTQKSQNLAKERQILAEEKTTWESQREQSRAALPEEYKQVALVDFRLAEVDSELDRPLDARGLTLRTVDWDGFRRQLAGLPSDDPAHETYAKLRDQYMKLRDSRIDLTEKAEAVRKDLQTKEEARLSEQQEKAAASLRQAQQETGRVLAAEVTGWNAQAAAKVIEFAGTHLGIAPEEMAEATDPRLWKALHGYSTALAENAALKKAQTQQKTADNHTKAQETKPAATPKGSGASARDPSTPRGDGLSVDEWMRRRSAGLAKKQA